MTSAEAETGAAAPKHHDPEVVAKAEAIFAEMGMTPEEAISLFYKQTALRGDFPITEWYPNEATQVAIEEARAGVGLVKYSSLDEFRAELDEIMADVDDAKSDQDIQLSA